MKDHICKKSNTCQCSMLATEPKESCPVHAVGDWPPRCEECGRFMKWEKDDATVGVQSPKLVVRKRWQCDGIRKFFKFIRTR